MLTCSHLALLRTWRCGPMLYRPGIPVRGTPRWPVWGPPRHHRRSPRCYCAVPPLALRSVLWGSCPPGAPWRRAPGQPCAEQERWSAGVQIGRDSRGTAAAGGSSRGERSWRLHREGLAIKREVESPTFFCLLGKGGLFHAPLHAYVGGDPLQTWGE